MPWESDKLDRQQFGRHVSDLLLARYESRRTFIVNLDAPWGQGKTFFLENLAQDLSGRGYPVAYVNAWQDDRTNTPLIAVLAAVSDALNRQGTLDEKAQAAIKKARRKLAPVVSEVAKQFGKHIIKVSTGVGVDGVISALDADEDYQADNDAISAGVDSVFDQALQSMEGRLEAQKLERDSIIAFRKRTATALKESKIKLPLFVIIDELDRCRPTYAVQMLEELKHIFSIEGVVFLIGTDTVQLSHSVNALYGNNFDSARYLRRFFDRVIVFPPVDRRQFIKSFEEDSFIDWDTFKNYGEVSAIEVFNSLFKSVDYSNRDIEQFFELVDTFVSSWDEDVKIEPIFLAALLDDYLRMPTRFAETNSIARSDERRANWSVKTRRGKGIDFARVAEGMQQHAMADVADYEQSWTNNEYFVDEYNALVANRMTMGKVRSLLSTYRERILLSARAAGN